MNLIEKLCDELLQPPRVRYSLFDLGKKQENEDHFKENMASAKILQHELCLVYLHSMNGSRLECISYVERILEKGIRFCCFDFSEDKIGFGAKEKYDIEEVMKQLRNRFNINRVILWGRSMGAACAIKYAEMVELNENTPTEGTEEIKPIFNQHPFPLFENPLANEIKVNERPNILNTNYQRNNNQNRMFQNNYQYNNEQSPILNCSSPNKTGYSQTIFERPVLFHHGLTPLSSTMCQTRLQETSVDRNIISRTERVFYKHASQEQINITNNSCFFNKELPLEQKSAAQTTNIYIKKNTKDILPKIEGLILDSCYTSLEELIIEIGNAKTSIPSFLLKGGIYLIKGTLEEKGGFELKELNLVSSLTKIKLPILFMASLTDKVVHCHHSKELFGKYPYNFKELFYINGMHNESRDEEYVEKVINFVEKIKNNLNVFKKTKKSQNIDVELKNTQLIYTQRNNINKNNIIFNNTTRNDVENTNKLVLTKQKVYSHKVSLEKKSIEKNIKETNSKQEWKDQFKNNRYGENNYFKNSGSMRRISNLKSNIKNASVCRKNQAYEEQETDNFECTCSFLQGFNCGTLNQDEEQINIERIQFKKSNIKELQNLNFKKRDNKRYEHFI